jgi:hypothetical protein
MPQITPDLGDATELAEIAHLPRRLAIQQSRTGPHPQPGRSCRPPRQQQPGPPRRSPPVRLPPRRQRRCRTFRPAAVMITNIDTPNRVLDRITRITPTMRGLLLAAGDAYSIGCLCSSGHQGTVPRASSGSSWIVAWSAPTLADRNRRGPPVRRRLS